MLCDIDGIKFQPSHVPGGEREWRQTVWSGGWGRLESWSDWVPSCIAGERWGFWNRGAGKSMSIGNQGTDKLARLGRGEGDSQELHKPQVRRVAEHRDRAWHLWGFAENLRIGADLFPNSFPQNHFAGRDPEGHLWVWVLESSCEMHVWEGAARVWRRKEDAVGRPCAPGSDAGGVITFNTVTSSVRISRELWVIANTQCVADYRDTSPKNCT